MRSGWFDHTEPSLSTSLQGKQSAGCLCTSSGWFKHIEPHRIFSNHIITEIARCVEFCHMSSGGFDCTLGVALLLVMFAIMVLIYNTLHTTKPCPCPPPTIIPQSNRSQPQSSSTSSSVLSVVPLSEMLAQECYKQ